MNQGSTTNSNICLIPTEGINANCEPQTQALLPIQRPRIMSAYSASLSPVDDTEEPPPFSAALLQSRSLLQAKPPGSAVSHPRLNSKCNEAAIDSATEQRLWIQSTLNGAKHRGDDWIEPIFKDDESSGCSACLPDIVVVNDAVNKFSDAFASKASAPWQRILTKAEADECITPKAASTMPTSIPDTYLYNDKRWCTTLQKFCAKFYMGPCFECLFGGGRSSTKLPNTEPAQNFRCGTKALRERASMLVLFVAALCVTLRFFGPVFIRMTNSIYLVPVDYKTIHTLEITCAGCKIQITNPSTGASNWAGLFHPNNVIMYFPKSNEVLPFSSTGELPEYKNGKFEFPGFCQNGLCKLIVKNFERAAFSSNRRRVFSDDSVDFDFYPYPTIDLIIDRWWNGTLIINSGFISSREHHPTIIVPFKASPLPFLPLFPEASSDVVLPSLSLKSDAAEFPIFFNGARGGRYRNVTVECVTGSFIARGAEFVEGSVVNITLPMGDVIISADQRIETTLSSIYSATPPSIDFMRIVNASEYMHFVQKRLPYNIDLPDAQLFISVEGYNFRNVAFDDLKLIVSGRSVNGGTSVNGICKQGEMRNVPLPGLGTGVATFMFACVFDIKYSGFFSGPVLLSYFGGNLKPTGFELKFSASLVESASIVSAFLSHVVENRYTHNEKCGSGLQVPENVCAVAAKGTSKVPFFSVATANDPVIMLPANIEFAKQNSFKFLSLASRSLTLGSFVYKEYTSDRTSLLESIVTDCGLAYIEHTPGVFFFNQHYNIPYGEQEKLLNAIDALNRNITEFVIIKTQGSGSNLPGYFTLTKKRIYTVIDPYIIQTLTFRLLPIHISTITVSFGAGLCPDLSSANQDSYYEWPRIAQNYEILKNFLTVEEDETMHLSFQFQSSVQIFKSGFTPYVEDIDLETSGFELDPLFYLGVNRESWLLYVSIILPELASLCISIWLINYAFKKLYSYRINLFQSTIEGERLFRIAPFSELAQEPYVLTYTVRDLVRKSPRSAHLQSKFKADLLKLFSLFEIKERRPMPEHIRWACKVRPTPFSWKNYFLSKISFSRHNFTRLPDSEDSNADVLAGVGVKDSFKNYIFKSVKQKYSRKVCFSQVALEKSLKCPDLEAFKDDKFIDFDFSKSIFEATITRKLGGKLVLQAKSSVMGPLQLKSVEVRSEDDPCDKEVRYRIQNVIVTDQTAGTFTLDLYSLKDLKKLEFSEAGKTIKLRFDNDTILEARVVESESVSVLKTNFLSMGPNKIYDFVVVRFEDRPVRYSIRNVHMLKQTTENDNSAFCCTFDLYSLKDFKRLDLSEYKSDEKFTLRFDDPYRIDDEFIDYAFSNNAFEQENLAASLKRVYVLGKNGSNSGDEAKNKEMRCCGEDSDETFGAPTFETDEKLRWNPFKDRLVLTVAAIFLESIESYRAIVSATGVESFCDMLIVNGSSQLRKWKLLGSIDEIMDAFHKPFNIFSKDEIGECDNQQNTSKNGSQSFHRSRIPAFSNGAAPLNKITCKRSDLNSVQQLSSADDFHSDCSLHYWEDGALPTASCGSFRRNIQIVADDKFTENNEWLPFQPGCTFEIEWHQAPTNDIRFEVNHSHLMPTIKTDLANFVDETDASSEFPCPCYMHIQCFNALQQKVEAMSTDECEVNSTDEKLYSHQLLDAYKPKGTYAIHSMLLHSIICALVICPTLAFFALWGFNAVDTYSIHPYKTPAAYFVIFSLIYMSIVFLYFFLVYMEFPYLFYGKSMCSSNISHSCFKPFTGAWLSNMRALFHFAVCLMLVLDFMAIILFLIWLCLVSVRAASCFAFCIKAPRAFRKFLVQGVVVRPALAIPYFTGVAAFIGNIISLSAAIRNWQDTVINLALEKLQTFLDLNPFKSTMLSAIDAIIETLGPLEGTIGVSPFFSRIPGEKVESVRAIQKKLQELRVFIASSEDHAVASASTAIAIKDEAAARLHATRRASSAVDADALQRDVRDVSRLKLRKLKESEMVALFSNLWSSIREELGLSSRDIVIALIMSSLILGLFLSFIFIGIGIFSDGTDPFAAIVNAGLTISAGLGEKQRSQSQTSDTAKGSAMLDEMLSSLLLALESRLKKSKLAIIQIFVVMMSTESESAAIISTLQELKFGMEALCSENDSKTDFNDSTISTISQQDVPVSFARYNSRRASRVQV